MSYARKPRRGSKGSASGGKTKPGGDGSGKSSARSNDATSGARVRMPDEHKPKVSHPGDSHEREAEAIAQRVVSGGKAGPISTMQGSAVGREAKAEEEKEPVAREAKAEEEKPVARLVSRAPAATEEKKPVARAGGEGGGGPAPAAGAKDAAGHALSSPGPGSPLDPSTRAVLGPRMGMDLGSVRVHDDEKAHDAAAALDARAFTRGNDIWLGRGESQRDLRLMAHEVTHVAQQKGGVNRSIQRAKKGAAAPASTAEVEGDKVTVPGKGSIDAGGQKQIVLANVRIPSWKLDATPQSNLDIPKIGERETDQVKVWEKEVKPEINPQTEAKLDGSDVITDTVTGSRIFFLEYAGGSGFLLGSKAKIKERVRRPEWDKDGKPHYFDVDHKQEVQLGGKDLPANMWLLDAEANQTSGSNISTEINQKVSALLTDARLHLGDKVPGSAADARKLYPVRIEKVNGGLPTSGNPAAHWNVDDVQSGKPLEKLKVLSEKDAKKRNLIGPGTESRLMIFTSSTGGAAATIPWKPETTEAAGSWPLFQHFTVKKVKWTGSAGSFTGTGVSDNRMIDPITLSDVELAPHGSVKQAAVVSGRNIESKLRDLQLKGLSPITISFAELRDPTGIYVRGQVLPNVPLIAGAGIDLVVDGNDVYLEKVFSTADFKFPGPIKVTEASLALAAGTKGLSVTGNVFFEIPRVGKGSLGASATATAAGAGLTLEGQFDFDPGLFDPAQIKVWYRDQKFGARGEIGVPKGKVRGLKSANVTVTFEEERIEAKGTFEPDIKGVQSGDLTVTYVEGTGLQIAGTLKLSNEVPGLKSGTIEASVKQKGEAWSLAGAITAEAGIPGITASVTGSYEDGGWQVEGTAGYEKGFLKGTVTVGATNRPVGDDGRPAGEGGDKLSAYGGGEVTLKLAPWLQGTVGLKIKPDGNMIVSGKIGLPSAFDLFPEKKLEKNIFSINLDIPIVGFSVLGQRVGIFATIGGGLDAEAAIGPGQLRQAELGVTYDPANEAATTVTGAAQLHIPAHAGLRLFVRGGIGAGIPLVSATAGLELGGRLGVEAALQSDLQVNWTPATGLVLDATLEAYAQPKFKFDITGFVEVTIDYFFGEETLYEKKWELAAIEYGSDLRFGLKLPLHYEEGKAFDVSLSDVEFEYPQIEPSELLAGLVKQLA